MGSLKALLVLLICMVNVAKSTLISPLLQHNTAHITSSNSKSSSSSILILLNSHGLKENKKSSNLESQTINSKSENRSSKQFNFNGQVGNLMNGNVPGNANPSSAIQMVQSYIEDMSKRNDSTRPGYIMINSPNPVLMNQLVTSLTQKYGSGSVIQDEETVQRIVGQTSATSTSSPSSDMPVFPFTSTWGSHSNISHGGITNDILAQIASIADISISSGGLVNDTLTKPPVQNSSQTIGDDIKNNNVIGSNNLNKNETHSVNETKTIISTSYSTTTEGYSEFNVDTLNITSDDSQLQDSLNQITSSLLDSGLSLRTGNEDYYEDIDGTLVLSDSMFMRKVGQTSDYSIEEGLLDDSIIGETNQLILEKPAQIVDVMINNSVNNQMSYNSNILTEAIADAYVPIYEDYDKSKTSLYENKVFHNKNATEDITKNNENLSKYFRKDVLFLLDTLPKNMKSYFSLMDYNDLEQLGFLKESENLIDIPTKENKDDLHNTMLNESISNYYILSDNKTYIRPNFNASHFRQNDINTHHGHNNYFPTRPPEHPAHNGDHTNEQHHGHDSHNAQLSTEQQQIISQLPIGMQQVVTSIVQAVQANTPVTTIGPSIPPYQYPYPYPVYPYLPPPGYPYLPVSQQSVSNLHSNPSLNTNEIDGNHNSQNHGTPSSHGNHGSHASGHGNHGNHGAHGSQNHGSVESTTHTPHPSHGHHASAHNNHGGHESGGSSNHHSNHDSNSPHASHSSGNHNEDHLNNISNTINQNAHAHDPHNNVHHGHLDHSQNPDINSELSNHSTIPNRIPGSSNPLTDTSQQIFLRPAVGQSRIGATNSTNLSSSNNEGLTLHTQGNNPTSNGIGPECTDQGPGGSCVNRATSGGFNRQADRNQGLLSLRQDPPQMGQGHPSSDQGFVNYRPPQQSGMNMGGAPVLNVVLPQASASDPLDNIGPLIGPEVESNNQGGNNNNEVTPHVMDRSEVNSLLQTIFSSPTLLLMGIIFAMSAAYMAIALEEQAGQQRFQQAQLAAAFGGQVPPFGRRK